MNECMLMSVCTGTWVCVCECVDMNMCVPMYAFFTGHS